jgi:hypothetical protein
MYDRIKPECNEELGEIICPECKGKGVIEHGKMEFMDYVCPKCQGEGKLDWCQQAVGVKPKPIGFDSSGYYTFSTYAAASGRASTSGGKMIADVEAAPNHFHQLYMNQIDKAAQQMADDVDREILRSLENAVEHNNDIKIEVDKRRHQGYDYGVFSKLMLFLTAKSKDKDKKN